MSGDVHVRFCESRGVGLPPATHLLVMCKSRSEAERAQQRLGEILAEMGLELKAAKTRIVKLEVGGEGVDFLGFHHRLVRARGRQGTKRVVFLARWPSRRALQHARERIRQLTDRSRLLVPFEQVVAEVNRFLRGWAGYFRIGNSARMFDKIMTHTLDRICLFVAKLHKRHRRYGWAMLRLSPNRLGLITLEGTVVAPRPNRSWRALVAEHRR